MGKHNSVERLADAVRFLSETGWLATRPQASRDLILGSARLVTFAPQQSVYVMGDPGNGIYGFVTGGLQILLPNDDGQVVVIHRTEPGFWVGDSALFGDGKRLVSLIASVPTVGVHIPMNALTELTAKHPELFHDFYSLSHRNLATSLRLLANLAVRNSERRLALRLLHYEELSGTPGGWLNLSQETLADLIAVSLPTLQRALRTLGQAGCVEVGYGKLRILDRQKLIAFCQE